MKRERKVEGGCNCRQYLTDMFPLYNAAFYRLDNFSTSWRNQQFDMIQNFTFICYILSTTPILSFFQSTKLLRTILHSIWLQRISKMNSQFCPVGLHSYYFSWPERIMKNTWIFLSQCMCITVTSANTINIYFLIL